MRTISELYSIGVVNGDFASQNLFIHSDTLDVKLIDFDLTFRAGSLVRQGESRLCDSRNGPGNE